jgi:ADP-heptose:LPS heptosyltransferase
MAPDDFARIFVLTYEGIGDLVFVLPLLYELHHHWPDARVQLVASPVQRGLAGAIQGGFVDVVPHHATSLRELPALALAIRRFKPELFLDLDGGLRYTVLGMVSSARRRIHPPRELTRRRTARFHRETVPFNPSGHRVDTWLGVLDRLRLPRTRISFEFDAPDAAREQAEAVARRWIPPGSLALVPTSGNPVKDWPAESLQDTVNILSRDMGRNVVVLGKARRQPALANAVDLGGMTSLMADAHLLRYSGLFDVVTGVDTGVMQIAGSVSSDPQGRYDGQAGNRTVSLFGPTRAAVYRPYDPGGLSNFVVTPATPSRAMGHWGWSGDRYTRPYMKELASRDIVGQIQRHLDARRA